LGKLNVFISTLLIFYVINIFASSKPAVQDRHEKLGQDVPITGNTEQLSYFLKALKNAKNEKVRIGLWGDSIIEGDVITENLRDYLQKLFRGNGIGFVSMTPDDYRMRKTIDQTFSDDWSKATLFGLNPNNWPIGLNAGVYLPAEGSWVKFKVSSLSKSMQSFGNIRMFYRSSINNCDVNYSIDNGKSVKLNLPKKSPVQDVTINANNAHEIRFNFQNCDSTYFYGVSFEEGNGVYVDNFSIKGNSGIGLNNISMSTLNDFSKLMNYKLIILSFGLNVLSPVYSDYNWYAEKMIKVVNHFKEAFPQASILIVSVGDRAIKQGVNFVSDPEIPLLIKAQKEIAAKTNVAFWNLFEAMGGKNSIINWVNAGPPLAYRDYAHLSYEGGEVVAKLLSDALLAEFKKY
jgi:lysophospholipase L1-like esterase